FCAGGKRRGMYEAGACDWTRAGAWGAQREAVFTQARYGWRQDGCVFDAARSSNGADFALAASVEVCTRRVRATGRGLVLGERSEKLFSLRLGTAGGKMGVFSFPPRRSSELILRWRQASRYVRGGCVRLDAGWCLGSEA